MHHIEIYVSDLKRSRDFYGWLLPELGYLLFQEWENGFSYRKATFYLVFVQTREKYLPNSYNRCNVGLNHLAFHCDSKDKIEALRKQLIKKKTPMLYEDRYPYAGGEEHFALFFEDPDRIKLEIVYEP